MHATQQCSLCSRLFHTTLCSWKWNLMSWILDFIMFLLSRLFKERLSDDFEQFPTSSHPSLPCGFRKLLNRRRQQHWRLIESDKGNHSNLQLDEDENELENVSTTTITTTNNNRLLRQSTRKWSRRIHRIWLHILLAYLKWKIIGCFMQIDM